MQMQYTDNGVAYTFNNVVVTYTGEQDYGEVHVGGVFVGYYDYDEDADSFNVTNENGVWRGRFANSEEGFAAFAEQCTE